MTKSIKEKIRVMAVYGDILTGRMISEALSGMEEVELSATALNARMAEARINRIPVDLLLFDVEDMDPETLETLKRIKQAHPDLGVLILSGTSSTSADKTIEALEMGAMDFITKPVGDELSLRGFTRELSIVIGMFRNRLNFKTAAFPPGKKDRNNGLPNTRGRVTVEPARPLPRAETKDTFRPKNLLISPQRFDAICIGISAGGPNALIKVVPLLPPDLPVPVLVVQHMPVLFTSSLAASLDKRSLITVVEAQNNMPVKPGTVYIAPGGKHMVLQKVENTGEEFPVQISLNGDPPENSCRPSVNYLFRSAAQVYRKHCLAIVMTGMGSDGLDGVDIIKKNGGYCITQTGDTCVVYGMPRVVDEAGLSDEKVPLDQIPARVVALVRSKWER